MGNLFLTKEARIYNAAKTASLINGAGKLDSYMWKNEIRKLSNTRHKDKLKMDSVQFSRSVMSDSLRPHESQHARPLCPSPTPGVYPDSCPSSWWGPPSISSFVVPFSSCPQSFPTSGSFQMSQLFTSDGQSIGVIAKLVSKIKLHGFHKIKVI